MTCVPHEGVVVHWRVVHYHRGFLLFADDVTEVVYTLSISSVNYLNSIIVFLSSKLCYTLDLRCCVVDLSCR